MQIKKLVSFQYYISLLKGESSFKSFFALLILTLLLSSSPIYFLIKDVYPVTQNIENKITNFINEVYPSELEIKIQKGIASSNVTEPYFITVNRETLENFLNFKQTNKNSSSKSRILAIDMKGKAEDFESYQSFALLTENSLVYYNKNEIKIYPLRDIQDLTITKNSLSAMVKDTYAKFHIEGLITVGKVVVPIFIFLGIFIVQFLFILMLSLEIYLMAKINLYSVSFWNNFRYSFGIAFLPLIIWNILLLIPNISRYMSGVSAVLYVIILALAYVGIQKIKQGSKSDVK